jgi:murein DD-endopeptidase MepM/ murein hydrolase activator NlpD
MDINRSVLTWVAIVIFVLIAIGWYAGNQNVKEKSNPTLPLALTVTPEIVIQGDPVMITLAGTTTSANIKSGSVSATALSFMIYQNTPTSFYGTGINQKTGSTTVTVILNDGTKKGKPLTATFFIKPRIRPEEPLPIPAQLGGNSPANQIVVENTLDIENAKIAAVPSYKKGAFWTEAFAFPLATGLTGLKVTDPYGYNRDTGEITIPHKGTDFKAASGTPVYAINDGLVRLTSTFVVYGNTVIIDHGLGIESLYMHLSRIVATPGEVVKRGQLIGYSGETGYAVGPHLHLSIKIGGVSIDPMKFFALFGLSGA